MTLEKLVKKYQQQYSIVEIVNLDEWYNFSSLERPEWLRKKIESLYQERYDNDQRIIFTLSQGDEYLSNADSLGLILKNFQELLNQFDISNFFVIVLSADLPEIKLAAETMHTISTDSIPVLFDYFDSDTLVSNTKKIANQKSNIGYNYNSIRPLKIAVEDLTDLQKQRLFDSKEFCIYPWMHMFVEPSGRVFPCCGATYNDSSAVGNTNQNSLKKIWNSTEMRQLRINMLNNTPSKSCDRCYEQERAGFFSMRNSANKHHGHHISLTDTTKSDGTVEKFSMVYWDVRFSNLCNLRCRSCGPSFSSSWYQDQIKIAPDYSNNHKPLIFAGKYETDLWEQLIEHIDHVEQIYFAGGEPLMMDEHYRILEELESRKKFNVRLIYNTNFTQIRLKNRTVFDYWKKFDSVSVGASLDASGARAEYIRKGTVWADVEYNRQKMLEVCPNVDFYISPTLSILNALHLPDFHRDWVDRGLIRASDLNVNILQDPMHYRIDIAHTVYKKKIQEKFEQHLEWLKPLDSLCRATTGFESAIKFLNATDNSHLYSKFWNKTAELDQIRNERLLDAIPELSAL